MDLRKGTGVMLLYVPMTPEERLAVLTEFAAVARQELRSPRRDAADFSKRVVAAIGFTQPGSHYVADCEQEAFTRKVLVDIAFELLPELLHDQCMKQTGGALLTAYPVLAPLAAEHFESCSEGGLGAAWVKQAHLNLVGQVFHTHTFCPEAREQVLARVLREWDLRKLVRDAERGRFGAPHAVNLMLALISSRGSPGLYFRRIEAYTETCMA